MHHTLQHLLESLSSPENFLLIAWTEYSSVSEYKMIIVSFYKDPPEAFAKAPCTWFTTKCVCFHCESLPLGMDQGSSAGIVTHASSIKVDTC